MPRGKPFAKGKSGNPSGRPKKTVTWKAAEDALREAIPRIMQMTKNEQAQLLQNNPTGAEMLAMKYVHEHVPQTVERFLGKSPDIVKSEVTGKDGAPLVPEAKIDFSKFKPEELRKLIEATK